MVFGENSLKHDPPAGRETKARRPSIKISSELMQIQFTYLYPAFHNNRSQEAEGEKILPLGVKRAEKLYAPVNIQIAC